MAIHKSVVAGRVPPDMNETYELLGDVVILVRGDIGCTNSV